MTRAYDTRTSWLVALLHALPALGLILYLLHRWFAIADRYFIFLYYHDMGSGFDTTPFGRETASRYWMAGLVADGAVLLLYAGGGWLMGRLLKTYRAPGWWRVWAVTAVVLVIAIPLITMTANSPALHTSNAAQMTMSTIGGLALVFLAWQTVVRQPTRFFWLALDAWGLYLLLYNLSNVFSRLGRWLAHGRMDYVFYWGLMLAVGLVWLLIITGLRRWRRTGVDGVAALMGAGFAVTYLLMPLFHHVYVTFADGYAYITNSDNFFADTVPLQLLAWLIALLFVFGLTRLRQSVAELRNGCIIR